MGKQKAIMGKLLKKLRAINPITSASKYAEPLELGFQITEPCAACPFRSDIKPYYFPLLGQQIVELAEGHSAFTCHETDPRSDYQGERRFGGKPQHCAGAAIFLDNTGVWNRAMTDAFLAKPQQYDNQKMSKKVPVYKTLRGMLSAYMRELAKKKKAKYLEGNDAKG